ncbi:MAG: hypothetical protein M3295_00265 [Chloroflexota bacterium]|nr:hypothetical protein [Chloroflexota bacterium]
MRKALVFAAACASSLLVGLTAASAAAPTAVCTESFTGTARDLTVPEDTFCDLSGATITHDLVVQSLAGVFAHDGVTIGHDAVFADRTEISTSGARIGHDLVTGTGASIHLELTTIGHDLVASQPETVQTGKISPESPGGTVRVGRDIRIDGSPQGYEFVFDGLCDLVVGRDLRMANRAVTLGVGIGDNCAMLGRPPVTVGRDLVVTGSSALVGFFGPSALEVGNNHVGRDLVFVGNTAAPGGYLEVADNVVGRDAICAANNPPPTGDAEDGPNIVGRRNTCG